MKPNNPLTRETLLRLAHRSLEDASTHDDGSPGNGGTLGAAVRQIMATLSFESIAEDNEVANENVNAIPVPLYEVAAYVDGTLDDQSKLDRMTRAAAKDPGLMMEIVAAVRSRSESARPRLSADLRSRLIAIQANGLSEDSGTPALNSEAAPRSKPRPNQEPIPAIRPAQRERGTDTNDRRRWALTGNTIALVVTAAVLFIVVGWWVRSEVDPQNKPIAIDPTTNHSPELVPPEPNGGPYTDESNHGEDHSRTDPLLVERTESSSTPSRPRDSTPSVDPDSRDKVHRPPPDSPSTNLASEDKMPDTSPRLAVESPTRAPDNNDPVDDSGMPTRPHATPSKLVAEWSQIDGLLLRSVRSGQRLTSAAYDSSPQSVVAGNTFDLASNDNGSRIRLQTLPWCRARAELVGGGELVMAADTQIELTFGGAIELQYGSIAFLGLNENLVVRLGRNLANSIALESSPDGGIVVQKTVGGMQVDVTGQGVKVDGRPVVDSRLSVDASSMQPVKIDDAPDRLPRWTRQRVDRIEVGRNVLAQLSESSDVRATMMQSLRSGAVTGEAAMTIRAWIIASSLDDFPRLIGSQDALLREAAMQYLRMVDPKDPRHRALWQSLQARAANPRTFASIRSYFVDLWAQRRPNPTRRDQLLRMLQANEPATRVAANYLLRNFYGAGPPFDFNANAAARARTVNAWRTVISRVESSG